ncbi:hypothetical protein H8958_016211 [Nasalis larvatus]
MADSRRQCILMGIYPHEPKHKKVNKGATAAQTCYLMEDIRFLLQKFIFNKVREYKESVWKPQKAYGKSERNTEEHVKGNKIDHKHDRVIKEWYPIFIDTWGDLGGAAFSMCFLFSTFPWTDKSHVETIQLCCRLAVKFMHYIITPCALSKVFVSIKGIYYQAEVLVQPIVWINPYAFSHDHPTDMDFRVMATFT